jgi:DNA-3-methyladenine glycosylase II
MTIPHYWEDAKKHLCKKDKVMASIIKSLEGEALKRTTQDTFTSLARAIIGQQISVKAADSIWKRFVTLTKLDPKKVLKMDDDKLKSAGLSGSKVKYIKSIAEFVKTHNGKWHEDDDEVIKELVKIKGVGRWTAEMFLIFFLQRPNILPLDDLGLLKSIEKHYGTDRKNLKKIKGKHAKDWRPYNSVATWYLWRSLDPVAVDY